MGSDQKTEHSEAIPESSGSSDEEFTQVNTRKLIRKLDWAIVPLIALLYLLSFLDRSNIGNARLAGLEIDLGMGGIDYNIAVAAFFPTYILAEVPSNLMLKKLSPSVWISFIMVVWAICTTLLGIVHNFAGLIAARAALGLAEGGLFPGVSFYITMWYKRRECGFRMSLFFSAATFAGAFGGLLARGLMEMDGIGGLDGWAWIFIIEGLATFVVGVATYFIMSDSPATAKFLNAAERKEVERRLTEDRNGLSEEFKMQFVYDALKDWKIWIHSLILVGNLTPLYCVSFFLPTIIRDLGYTNSTAQLMTVPPYVVACLFCISGGFFADRLGNRGFFMMAMNVNALIGLIMLLTSQMTGVRYAGTFFFASGVYPQVPQGVAWNSNNIGGGLKRSIGIGLQAGLGNLGGIISAFIFLPDFAPRYIEGTSILIAFQAMSLALTAFMCIYLRKQNAKRDEMYKPPSAYTAEEKELEREKGDDATFFRFTL